MEVTEVTEVTEESSQQGSRPVCPKCDAPYMTRLQRMGFLEESVYSKFGYFPWECMSCRKKTLLRERGERYRRREDES